MKTQGTCERCGRWVHTSDAKAHEKGVQHVSCARKYERSVYNDKRRAI